MQTFTAQRQLERVIFLSDEPENNRYEVSRNQFSKEIMDYFYLILHEKSLCNSNENHNRLNKKLREFANYKEDWDDEKSPEIEKNAINNVSSFLEICNDDLLSGWSLFPSPNGTLTLEKHKEGVNAVIEIGSSLMSYSATASNIKLMGKEPFSANSIINILNKLQ